MLKEKWFYWCILGKPNAKYFSIKWVLRNFGKIGLAIPLKVGVLKPTLDMVHCERNFTGTDLFRKQESPPLRPQREHRPLRSLSGGCGQTDRHLWKHYLPASFECHINFTFPHPSYVISISENQRPSKKSDIYSYSIILVEIFTREDPYQELRGHMEPTEIIREVMRSHLRPDPKHVQPVTVRGGLWLQSAFTLNESQNCRCSGGSRISQGRQSLRVCQLTIWPIFPENRYFDQGEGRKACASPSPRYINALIFFFNFKMYFILFKKYFLC